MTLPNLASRPFLNTRPVWWVTGAATFFSVVLLIVNVSLYFSGSRHLVEKLQRRARLVEQETKLSREVDRDVKALAGVRWRALGSRVDRVNGILGGYAFSWLGLMNDLGRVLPRQVRLYKVSPHVTPDGVVLAVSGTAQTREAMLDLLENLIQSPQFFNPLPRSEKTPDASKSAGYEFRLRVGYRPGGTGS